MPGLGWKTKASIALSEVGTAPNCKVICATIDGEGNSIISHHPSGSLGKDVHIYLMKV